MKERGHEHQQRTTNEKEKTQSLKQTRHGHERIKKERVFETQKGKLRKENEENKEPFNQKRKICIKERPEREQLR